MCGCQCRCIYRFMGTLCRLVVTSVSSRDAQRDGFAIYKTATGKDKNRGKSSVACLIKAWNPHMVCGSCSWWMRTSPFVAICRTWDSMGHASSSVFEAIKSVSGLRFECAGSDDYFETWLSMRCINVPGKAARSLSQCIYCTESKYLRHKFGEVFEISGVGLHASFEPLGEWIARVCIKPLAAKRVCDFRFRFCRMFLSICLSLDFGSLSVQQKKAQLFCLCASLWLKVIPYVDPNCTIQIPTHLGLFT